MLLSYVIAILLVTSQSIAWPLWGAEETSDDYASLRDQQMRARLVSQVKLPGQPFLVKAIPTSPNEMSLAVHFTNSTEVGGQTYLGQLSNLSNVIGHDNPDIDFKLIGDSDQGFVMNMGEVLPEHKANVQLPYWWITTRFNSGSEGKIVLLPINGDGEEYVVASCESCAYSGMDWQDMDQDGWPDIVASRTRGIPNEETMRPKESQLVWFKNPGTAFITRQKWKMYEITKGPDIDFKMMKVPLGEKVKTIIIALGYHSQKMYALWVQGDEDDWTNVDMIREKIVGNHESFFNIHIADVNADGRADVIVSTSEVGSMRSSLYAYEIPCDWVNMEWKRHQLVDGGDPMSDSPYNTGTNIQAFHPVVRDYFFTGSKKKPFILISGDVDGYVKVLTPKSRNSINWEYNEHVIFRGSGFVGPVATGDFNYDGYTDLVCNQGNRLFFLTYKPTNVMYVYNTDVREMEEENIDATMTFMHKMFQEHDN